MSEVALGRMSSAPDKDGKHKLRCPKCHADFLSFIARADYSELQGISCPQCDHEDAPLNFVGEYNKDEVMDLARDYVKSDLKRAFKNSKNIKFK